MRKNLDIPVLSLKGLVDGNDSMRNEDGTPLLMKQVIVQALMGLLPVDHRMLQQLPPPTQKDKEADSDLARRLLGSTGEIELSAEELVQIKKAVSISCIPLVVGQLKDCIET